MDDITAGFLSLEDPLPQATRAKERPTFPCGQCAGSGKWTSPSGRMTGDCRACRGVGHFLTPPKQRAKNRASRVEREQRTVAQMREQFEKDHPEVVAEILRGGSEFMASLSLQLFQKGSLSEKQVICVLNGIEKRKARAEVAEQNKTEMDLTKIRAMFDRVMTTPLKSPVFRAAGLALSLAKPHSANPGCIYVKHVDSGEYCGKVDSVHFRPVRGGEQALEGLRRIEANPLEAAIEYGRLSGRCACCGRLLVNDKVPDADGLTSVERGIGPICARKWGLM